jgi:hypothetical protein
MKTLRTLGNVGVPESFAMGLPLLLLAFVVIGWGGASAALASTTYTLSGSGNNGGRPSPDSETRFVSVHATLSRGVAHGTLETGGNLDGSGGPFYEFAGHVTCMKVFDKKHKVTVGAHGTVSFAGTVLPGKYAQILTVEFGTFESLEPEGETITYTDSFGASEKGVKSSKPPTCSGASFSEQYLPRRGGIIQLTTTT